jgi:hypothetical protein
MAGLVDELQLFLDLRYAPVSSGRAWLDLLTEQCR